MSEISDFENLPFLHIYPQRTYHGPAEIMGTRTALVDLRDAIDLALKTGMEAIAEGIVVDGESYAVIINIRNLAALEKRSLPYYGPPSPLD